ncbi:MAG: penicillin-binding protein 1A [Ancalomicrobiaceae bacterium]|nr:penicillin-binding protein 1A [Ancalomicrobiaceae bacterium]
MRSRRIDRSHEPNFDDEADAPDALDLRLSPADRPSHVARADGPARARPARSMGNGRIEPTIMADGGELRVRSSEARGRSTGRIEDEVVEQAPPQRAAKSKRRRSRGGFFGFFARIFYWCFVLSIWGAIGIGGVVLYYGARLPPTSEWTVPKRPPNIKIVSADGELMGNRGDTGGEAVKLKDLPPYLPQALIAIEDRRFYSHFGIDPIGLARAVVNNVIRHRGMQGGSTLTQQLAKNLFLTPDRTLGRKVQEVLLALWLERTYTKDQILELYLNRVYMGAGAYGVDAAARRYFGKSAKDVNIMEAAMLAGLLKAPSRYAPSHNPQLARERAETVLAAMVDAGFLSEKERQAALTLPRVVFTHPNAGSENYVADWVMDLLPYYVGSVDSDIVVETTVDSNMQLLAEAALQGTLAQYGDKKDVSQGALVALDPTGGVKAMIGGVEYEKSQYNRAVAARRQPGSSFKVFTYLAAMEAGLTPETVKVDEPVSFHGWAPKNFGKEYKGPVTLKDALAHSINTIAAKLAVEVGPRKVASVAERLGITSPLQANASIALGTSEVTPLELTGAYVPFSNGGFGVVPHVIKRIRTANGKVLFEHTGNGPGRVIDPLPLAEMDTMLAETLISGSGKKAQIPGWPTGGKTGTSQDSRDAWFLGFTGLYTVGVWLGNDDSSPTNNVTGGSLASIVWHRFMVEALRGKTPVPIPGSSYQPPSLFAPQQPQQQQPWSAQQQTQQIQPQPVQQRGEPLTTGTINRTQPAYQQPPGQMQPMPPPDDTPIYSQPEASAPIPLAPIDETRRRAPPPDNGPVDGFLRHLFGAN